MANKLFSAKNLAIGAKGLVSSILTALILALPAALVRWIYAVKMMYGLAMLGGLVLIIAQFLIWGYLSNKLWKWN